MVKAGAFLLYLFIIFFSLSLSSFCAGSFHWELLSTIKMWCLWILDSWFFCLYWWHRRLPVVKNQFSRFLIFCVLCLNRLWCDFSRTQFACSQCVRTSFFSFSCGPPKWCLLCISHHAIWCCCWIDWFENCQIFLSLSIFLLALVNFQLKNEVLNGFQSPARFQFSVRLHEHLTFDI